MKNSQISLDLSKFLIKNCEFFSCNLVNFKVLASANCFIFTFLYNFFKPIIKLFTYNHFEYKTNTYKKFISKFL